MNPPLKNLVVGIGSLAAALSFAACGSDDSSGEGGDAKASDAREEFLAQSGTEIAEDAVAAMKDVKSLRIKGDVTEDGKVMSLDFTVDGTTGNCSGSFGQDGQKADLISLDQEQYMRADGAFWKAQADNAEQGNQMATMLGGKWVKIPTSAEDFGELCDIDELLGEFSEAPEKDEKVTKGEVEEVAGVDAIALTGDDDGEKATVWVAVDGEHYIVKVEIEGDEPGTLEFLDIDDPAEIKAPPASDVVDMTG